MKRADHDQVQMKELMEGKGIARPAGAASVDERFKKAAKAQAKLEDQDELTV